MLNHRRKRSSPSARHDSSHLEYGLDGHVEIDGYVVGLHRGDERVTELAFAYFLVFRTKPPPAVGGVHDKGILPREVDGCAAPDVGVDGTSHAKVSEDPFVLVAACWWLLTSRELRPIHPLLQLLERFALR